MISRLLDFIRPPCFVSIEVAANDVAELIAKLMHEADMEIPEGSTYAKDHAERFINYANGKRFKRMKQWYESVMESAVMAVLHAWISEQCRMRGTDIANRPNMLPVAIATYALKGNMRETIAELKTMF